MYTAVALLLVIVTIFSGSQALSWTDRVGPDGCTTIGVCPISSPVVPIEPTTSTQPMVTSEGPSFASSVALEFEDYNVEETVAQSASSMMTVPSTTSSDYNPATSVEMTVAVSTQRAKLTASFMPTTSFSSTTSGAPVMSTSSLTSCTTICPPTATTVEPTNPTTKPGPENPTTGSPTKKPTNAPASGSNVGLAVGLTLLALVVVAVVCVVAVIFIYRRYGKYRTSYEVLPTEK